MPYYYSYYFEPTYLLVILGALFCMLTSVWVNSAMKKYHREGNTRGLTGAAAAERILRDAGLYDVRVECLSKGSGDHYDPRTRTVRLSYENYNYATVTAVAVAAHECGHAKQHQEGYAPLKLRTAMAPAVSIANYVGMPLIFLGIFLSFNQTLINIGIWVFAIAVAFQLITLPVEFNASARALQNIEISGLLSAAEQPGAKKVLTAAAMTYVAGAAAALLQMLRLIILFGGNRRND
ncbi:MAG: zinc metallopeptidase [Lachnospiraceae bacterium]|nr:zinc metallopeptidase [Lachnospiraceae bacterium]